MKHLLYTRKNAVIEIRLLFDDLKFLYNMYNHHNEAKILQLYEELNKLKSCLEELNINELLCQIFIKSQNKTEFKDKIIQHLPILFINWNVLMVK